MRYWIVNLAYVLALFCAFPWLVYQALTTNKYREGVGAKFLGKVPVRIGQHRCIWLHAVSVGEVALAAVLVKKLRKLWPELDFVVSATSKSGYELARERFSNDLVIYAPLDFSWAVNKALDRVRPNLVLLIELEVWPNLIWLAHRRGVPVAIANGRLSAASHRGYRRIRPLMSSVMRCVSAVGAANAEYAERFVDLGVAPANVIVAGSIKFDGAVTARDNERTREFRRLAGFRDDDTVFIAGSTQDPEEMMALAAFRQLRSEYPELRLLLVPRHPERFDEVARQLDADGIAWARRSQLTAPNADADVLLVDSVGELSAWWGLADIAFVGGSMGSRGGQNMIEPAAYGAALCFGPNTRNFKDVTCGLLERNAARVVNSVEELADFVRLCLVDPDAAQQMGQRARDLVMENRGALQRTLEMLHPLLDSTSNQIVSVPPPKSKLLSGSQPESRFADENSPRSSDG